MFIFLAVVSNILSYHYQVQFAANFIGQSLFVSTAVFSLIVLQIITDLWNSKDFKRIYKSWNLNTRLRSEVFPLSTAYQQNEERLTGMLDLLEKKLKLDEKVLVINRQLEIWHQKFGGSQGQRTKESDEILEDKLRHDEGLINNFDIREKENFDYDRWQEATIAEGKWYERMIVSLFLHLRKVTNSFVLRDNFSLINFILKKNAHVLNLNIDSYKRPKFDMISYITDDNAEITKGISNIKEEINLRLEIIKKEENHQPVIGTDGKQTCGNSEIHASKSVMSHTGTTASRFAASSTFLCFDTKAADKEITHTEPDYSRVTDMLYASLLEPLSTEDLGASRDKAHAFDDLDTLVFEKPNGHGDFKFKLKFYNIDATKPRDFTAYKVKDYVWGVIMNMG